MSTITDNERRRFPAVIQLQGVSNYEAWLESIADYCQMRGLSGHFDGTAVKPVSHTKLKSGIKERPETSDDALALWNKRQNELLELLGYSTGSIHGLFLYSVNPQKNLNMLESLFCKPSIGNRATAMNAFLKVEADGSAKAFFSRLEMCLIRLRLYGVDMPDEICIPHVLAKLGKHRPGLVGCIELETLVRNMQEDITYKDAVKFCLRYDEQSPLHNALDQA